MDNICTQDELQHHGIKDQRWGIRCFQTKPICIDILAGTME